MMQPSTSNPKVVVRQQHNELDRPSTTCFVINGDWNANLREGCNSLFAKHMVQSCDDNGFILSSKVLLPADSFTHVSEAWGSVSWLDHIVSSSDFHNCIKTVSIDHDLSDADHIPVRMDISLDDIPGTSSCDEGSYRRICWDKLNADGRAKYRDVSHEILCQLIVPNAVYCTNVNCTDPYHITDTDSFYNEIMQCLIQASDTAFSQHNSIKGSVKPGWSDDVAELYSTSRDVAKLWGNAGKPRQGYLFELHRTSKARFKFALRYIKRNEASLRKESLASKLADGDSKGFWKLIKGDSNVRVPLPTSVEGVTGEANIANLWRTHYKDVFNTADEGCRAANYAVCNDMYTDIQVSYDELSSAIDYLDINKSCGLDGIYAEHLKFGSYLLADLLSQCISSFFTHGSLPDSMIANVLVPVIKSKTGRIMSKDNYRPIALASVVSKVAEIVIYNRISVHLDTCPNQFGFKRNHSTDQCMYLKRLSTLIVVVSSLVFWMRARHLTESTIPFYLVNCQTGESPDMLFEFYLTGMKISRCVYAGEGLILLFLCYKWGSSRQHFVALLV